MYKTFNGWRQIGRVVAAGEKGLFNNEYGDAMFSKSQTVPKGKQVTTYYNQFGSRIRRVVEYI